MAETRHIMLLVTFCCALLAACSARNIFKVNTERADIKCAEIRPGIQNAYGFHCFTPVGNMSEPTPQWTFNGEPVRESSKYSMGMRKHESYFNGEMAEMYDMHLIITDVGQTDIGEYSISVDMGPSHMEKTMMLPAALACGDHPLCYEDNCKWPERLVCRSNPDAYCQMDMCGQHHLCMPRWFVGAQEVTCDDVEGIFYHP